jgi:hypothetical protein
MPTLRSNAITQNGATMDFFSLVGIKLAKPSVQTNHGRLESDLVETTQTRFDSKEGIWGNSKSDPTSQQKQSVPLTRVYLSFNGDDDDPSSTWSDVREDEFGDACVTVVVDPATILAEDMFLSSDGGMLQVDDEHKSLDDEGNIIIKVNVMAIPAPPDVVSYSEQLKAAEALFSKLRAKQSQGAMALGEYIVHENRNVSIWTGVTAMPLPFNAPAGTAAGRFVYS